MALRNIYSIIVPLFAVVFCGCIKDDVPRPPVGDDCEIVFEFTVPDNTVAGTRNTPVLTTAENAIDDVYAFVFKVAGTSETLDYYTKATITGTTGAGKVTTGRLSLNRSAAGEQHRIVLVANAETEILVAESGGQLAAGTTYAAFAPLLTRSVAPIANGNPPSSFRFPMWGETGVVTISAALDLTGSNALNMQRCLAKVNVGVNMDSHETSLGLPDFEIREVTVYNVNTVARIVPDRENIGSDGAVTEPTVSGSSKTNMVRTMPSAGSLNSIYVPETVNNASTADTDRPCVVIKGIYKGADPANTAETYYKIDFRLLDDNKEWVDILRNHSYIFNIKAVYREGYTTAAEALDKFPLGMEYEFTTPALHYKHFVYNDVGYLGAVQVSHVFNYPSVSVSAYFDFVGEYMGDTDPVVIGYFCDSNGNPVAETRFESELHTNYVDITTVDENKTEDEVFTAYYKFYLEECPDLHMVVEIKQNPVHIISAVLTETTGFSEYPYLNYEGTYFLLIQGYIPPCSVKVTRAYDGAEQESYITNTISSPTGARTLALQGLSAHDSYYYEEVVMEWQHPFTGTWKEIGRFEQAGSSFRCDDTGGAYAARNDAPISEGSTDYAAKWPVHLGIDMIYNSTVFNPAGSLYPTWYPTTEETGCAVYYEGDPSDPVTGKGCWRVPTPDELLQIRNHLYNTLYGVPRGVYNSSGNYVSSYDNPDNGGQATMCRIIGNPTMFTGAKDPYTLPRARCVRDPKP